MHVVISTVQLHRTQYSIDDMGDLYLAVILIDRFVTEVIATLREHYLVESSLNLDLARCRPMSSCYDDNVLGVYFGTVMLMCTLSVIMTIIVLNLHHRSPDMYEMPTWVSSDLPDHLLFTAYICCIFRNTSTVCGCTAVFLQDALLSQRGRAMLRVCP